MNNTVLPQRDQPDTVISAAWEPLIDRSIFCGMRMSVHRFAIFDPRELQCDQPDLE